MANITRRQDESEQQRTGARPFWDPFGIFTGWASPFGALLPTAPARAFTPAFDVHETEDAYVFEADLPGIEEDKLEISVGGNQLSVRGRREAARRSQKEKYSCAERTYGTFERTFTLSDDAEPEQANAEFRDGVLMIEIAKRTEPQGRRVQLGGAQGDGDGGQQEGRSRRRPSGARRQAKRKR